MKEKIKIDVVIASYAKDDELKQVTEAGLRTLIASENLIEFNIFVVETNHDIDYKHIETFEHNLTTIHTDKPFGYHTYMNVGLEQGNSEWTCLCNNDLIFEKGWASNILQIVSQVPDKLVSASPLNPNEIWHQQQVGKLVSGYTVREHIAGWCLFQSRQVLDKIGGLDERIEFWFCDNEYSSKLQVHKIPHLLVGNSFVYHHSDTEGTTTVKVEWDAEKRHQMTFGAGDNFREMFREYIGDENWGKPTEEQIEELKKQGKEWY